MKLLKPPVAPVVRDAIAEASALDLRDAATTLAYKLAARTWGGIDQDNVVALIYSGINEELGEREARCARATHGHAFFDMGEGELRCGSCALTYAEVERGPIFGLKS